MVTINSRFLKLIDQNKKVSILVFSIIFVAIIDMELSNVSDIISNILNSSWGVVTFTFIVIIYTLAQYFLVKYVKDKSADLRTKQNVLQSVNQMVSLTQYSVSSVMSTNSGVTPRSYDLIILVSKNIKRLDNSCNDNRINSNTTTSSQW